MIEGVACETRLLSNDQAEENSHASSKAFCFWLLVTATLAFSPNKSVELSLRADSDSMQLSRSAAPCACWAWSFCADLEAGVCLQCYIPSCDIVAHVYLGSSVGTSHAFRAESRRFESRPVGFFSLFISISY